MDGDLRILNSSLMMTVLFTFPEADINSQDKKCPSSRNGPKTLSALILTQHQKLKSKFLQTHQSNTPNSSNPSRAMLMKLSHKRTPECSIRMATQCNNYITCATPNFLELSIMLSTSLPINRLNTSLPRPSNMTSSWFLSEGKYFF